MEITATHIIITLCIGAMAFALGVMIIDNIDDHRNKGGRYEK